jgi:hypothetical protein
MELPSAAYLYALATVSITFVGFSALLIVFRQSIGGGPTRYDTYFALSFIQAGFIVTAGALTPPLLALYGWPETGVWRVASLAMAIPMLWFVVRVPGRRRLATGRPVPLFVWSLLAVQTLAAAALLCESAGVLVAREPAVYASAMTAMLFSSGIAYLMALSVILPEMANQAK